MQFKVMVEKKVRQMARQKMNGRMAHAAEMTVSRASKYAGFNDVTGNLIKSIAVGAYYKRGLLDIFHTPGPEPLRPTLRKGERFDLTHYYGNPVAIKDTGKKPYKGEYGAGGQLGPDAAEDALYAAGFNIKSRELTWQMILVAGVSYANYVETKKKHDVISGLRDYMVRYFSKM